MLTMEGCPSIVIRPMRTSAVVSELRSVVEALRAEVGDPTPPSHAS
jgi:hypothetical protein